MSEKRRRGYGIDEFGPPKKKRKFLKQKEPIVISSSSSSEEEEIQPKKQELDTRRLSNISLPSPIPLGRKPSNIVRSQLVLPSLSPHRYNITPLRNNQTEKIIDLFTPPSQKLSLPPKPPKSAQLPRKPKSPVQHKKNRKKRNRSTDHLVKVTKTKVKKKKKKKVEMIHGVPKPKMKEFQKRAKGKYAEEEIIIKLDTEFTRNKSGKNMVENLRSKFNNSDGVIVERLLITNSIEFSRRLPKDYASFSNQSSFDSEDDEDDTGYEIIPVKSCIILRLCGDAFYKLVCKGKDILENYLLKVIQIKNEQYEKDYNVIEMEDIPMFQRRVDKLKELYVIFEGVYTYCKNHQNKQFKKLFQKNEKRKEIGSQRNVEETMKMLSREDIEKVIIHLENSVSFSPCSLKVFTSKDIRSTGNFIQMFSKVISTSYYDNQSESKYNLHSKAKSILGRKAKDTNDALLTFLMEIPAVSENQAKAIRRKVKTLGRLLKVYEDPILSEREKNLYLTKIEIDEKRKIGEVTSKKIFKYFRKKEVTMW